MDSSKNYIVYGMVAITLLTMVIHDINVDAKNDDIPIQKMPTIKVIEIKHEESEVVQASETPTVMELPTEKEYRYIQDCPLSKEIQQGIFDICEEYNISFEFVMSIIAQESSFRPRVIGDGGQSKGLMQIQAKWHSETIEELGVTDLFDPLQNVKVGVAILHKYFQENEEVYYVLMKYNGGEAYANKMLNAGKISAYAIDITERAIMYEEENGI